MTTTVTIHLDETLLSRLQYFVPPYGFEQWVNQLVADRLSDLERGEAEALMREGYIARRQESQETYEDWQAIDGEGWPS